MEDCIKEILSNKNKFKSEKWISENFSTFYFFIDQKIEATSWKEKLYLYINDLKSVPSCYCGSKLDFLSISKGYRKYCSKKCLSNDPNLIKKRENTCISRYGTKNPMESDSIKLKFKESILEKYGVDNISKVSEVKEKKRKTCFSNYGVEYNSQREEIRKSLSLKMKKNSEKLIKSQLLKNKDYLNFKLEKYGIEVVENKKNSIYIIRCHTGHLFNISKSNLNDRIYSNREICTICNPIIHRPKKVFNNDDFLRRSFEVHKKSFEYLSEYKSSHVKIKIKCNKCSNIFLQLPYAHLQNQGCPKCSRNISYKETLWLDQMGIDESKRQKRILIDDKYYNVDAYDESTNTIYEFYGDYWHGNLNVFNPDHINKTLNKKFGELYENTISRQEKLSSYGYNLKVIWEKEFNEINKKRNIIQIRLFGDFLKTFYSGNIINDKNEFLLDNGLCFRFNILDSYNSKYQLSNRYEENLKRRIHLINIWEDDWVNKKEIIKSRVLNLIGKSKIIYARKCEISEVKYYNAKKFLSENHIQGYTISKYNLGLYYNNELVSIMTFGKLRISLGQKHKEGNYELLRFCNKLNTTVVGGASKLFKHFLKLFDPEVIISYADRCWSKGDLYYNLGFKLDSISKPNYYYIIEGKKSNRFNWRKSKLIKLGYDPDKSESEIMRDLGNKRIYDAGNYKFIYYHLPNKIET